MSGNVIINIGRQYGSGGKSIALAIGERLNIPVYDNELIARAAEESGFSAEIFRDRDEKRRRWSVGSIFGSNRYGVATTSGLNDAEIFRIQSDVIRHIAESGDAIFVGRASDYVLRDMECLDVFVCAPKDVRIETVSKRRGISPGEADVLIEKMDKGRAEYYNFFTFGHWGKAAGYDLCIDSSLLGIEKTAEFIIDFGRKAGLVR